MVAKIISNKLHSKYQRDILINIHDIWKYLIK